MTSLSEHAQTLLAAIIPDRRDLLDVALQHLAEQHFTDRAQGTLFTLLERYADATGGVLTRQALADLLGHARLDAGTILSYQELYDELAQRRASDIEFRWALEQIRQLTAERATRDALAEAMQVLTQGLEVERGRRLQGHSAAREHLLNRLAEIDRDVSVQDAPEGDMRTEADDILADYRARKSARQSGRPLGVRFGVKPLDDSIDAVQNGELVLIIGATGDGKTSMCTQLAWSAAVQQAKNVLFLTTETPRGQVRRRLIARHSAMEQFGIPDGGITSGAIKNGTLDEAGEQRLAQVVADFTRNPGYGRVYLCQVPRGASMSYVESKMLRVQRLMHIDLVIMDYLALLKPDRRRSTDREELAGILKAAKQMAVTFNNGAGVPFVSPWQVSRAARVEAERAQHYTSAATSETAEASNSADQIIGLLAPLDNTDRRTKLLGQVVKNRDGEKGSNIELFVDYATCRFTAGGGASSTPDTTLNGSFDPVWGGLLG